MTIRRASPRVLRVCTILAVVVLVAASSAIIRGDAESTPEEAERLKFERLMKEDPKQARLAVLTSQMVLGRLGYGTKFDGLMSSATVEALKLFQADIGAPATGKLDLDTYQALDNREVKLDRLNVYLPHGSLFLPRWDSYVNATGTWEMEGKEQAFPLQTTEIQCHRAWKSCIEVTAQLQDRKDGSTPFLALFTEIHEVERWDEYEIVTKPDDKICVRYTLRISRRTKEVTGLRTSISDSEECKGIESEDIRLKLGDGTEALHADLKTAGETFSYYRIPPEVKSLLQGLE